MLETFNTSAFTLYSLAHTSVNNTECLQWNSMNLCAIFESEWIAFVPLCCLPSTFICQRISRSVNTLMVYILTLLSFTKPVINLYIIKHIDCDRPKQYLCGIDLWSLLGQRCSHHYIGTCEYYCTSYMRERHRVHSASPASHLSLHPTSNLL